MVENRARAPLSPGLEAIWGFLDFSHLVSATDSYIVFLDNVLDVDWKTTDYWDKNNPQDSQSHHSVLNRATALEFGDWDGTDSAERLNFKRQIGDAVARCLAGDYSSAEQMLDQAENYKNNISERRLKAIEEQLKIKDEWKASFKRWIFLHYVLGITALLFSTLVAAKPEILNFSEGVYKLLASLVAFLTGLLTLLAPDNKAGKYNSAWSLLSSQITRYRADKTYTVNDVLDAYQQGQEIIAGTAGQRTRRSRRN